jgi:Tol biopolymer transport system component
MRIPLEGGSAIKLADSAHNASWGDDGTVVYAFSGVVYRVAATGGEAALVARPSGELGHLSYTTPHVLPGSKAALISLVRRGGLHMGNSVLGVMELATGRVHELGEAGGSPQYMAGYVVFAKADGSLHAAPFSLRGLRLEGPSIPITDNVTLVPPVSADFATSSSGVIVYHTARTANARVVLVDRDGRARPLRAPLQPYASPRLDPTGKRLALTVGGVMDAPLVSGAPTPRDIWTYELPDGPLTRLTTNGDSYGPEWTPNGDSIVSVRGLGFMTATDRRNNPGAGRYLQVQPWDVSGGEVLYQRDSIGTVGVSIGPRNTYIVYRRGRDSRLSSQEIWIAPSDSPLAMRPFVATPAAEWEPRISPDGRFVAYTSDESGRLEVYVRPLPGPSGRVQVSIDGGKEPVWSADGRELFYRSPGWITSAQVVQSPRFAVTRRDTLFADSYASRTNHANYDVFPDGKRFVFIEAMGGSSELYAMFNWTEELRRRTARSDRGQ